MGTREIEWLVQLWSLQAWQGTLAVHPSAGIRVAWALMLGEYEGGTFLLFTVPGGSADSQPGQSRSTMPAYPHQGLD